MVWQVGSSMVAIHSKPGHQMIIECSSLLQASYILPTGQGL